MRIEEMRSYISNAYPGEKWKARCACMKKNQVIAIYYSLIKADRTTPKGAFLYGGQKVKNTQKTEGVQMTIFDLEV